MITNQVQDFIKKNTKNDLNSNKATTFVADGDRSWSLMIFPRYHPLGSWQMTFRPPKIASGKFDKPKTSKIWVFLGTIQENAYCTMIKYPDQGFWGSKPMVEFISCSQGLSDPQQYYKGPLCSVFWPKMALFSGLICILTPKHHLLWPQMGLSAHNTKRYIQNI